MSAWEYKVVPAPTKGVKAPGVKTGEARFAHALEVLMNQMGAQGWAYQRAETLPSLERAGLTGTTTEWRNVLVFRRAVVTAMDAFEPELLPPPVLPEKAAPVTTPTSMPEVTASQAVDKTAPGVAHSVGAGAPMGDDLQSDNGVEDTSDVAGITASLRQLITRRTPANSDT